MTTGQPDGTAPQHGSSWEKGCHALNCFLASFPSEIVTIEDKGGYTFHLYRHGREKLEPFCILALSSDCLQMVIRRGDQTWRAPITRPLWLLDGSDKEGSSEDMVKELTGHSPREAPLTEEGVAGLLIILEQCPDLQVKRRGLNTVILHPEGRRIVIIRLNHLTIISAYDKDKVKPTMLAEAYGEPGEPRYWKLVDEERPEGTKLTEAGMQQTFINWLKSGKAG